MQSVDILSSRGDILLAAGELNLAGGLVRAGGIGMDVDLDGLLIDISIRCLGCDFDIVAAAGSIGANGRVVGDGLQAALHGPGIGTSVRHHLVDGSSLTEGSQY